MPVSTLRWTASGIAAPVAATALASASIPLAVYTTGVSRVHDGLGRVGHRLRQHEDRRVDARVAQLDAFLDERDAEHRGARVDRGPTHRDRAVAVAVGLDDREQLGRRGDRLQRPNVVAIAAEVDLRPDRSVRGHASLTSSER